MLKSCTISARAELTLNSIRLDWIRFEFIDRFVGRLIWFRGLGLRKEESPSPDFFFIWEASVDAAAAARRVAGAGAFAGAVLWCPAHHLTAALTGTLLYSLPGLLRGTPRERLVSRAPALLFRTRDRADLRAVYS